MTDTPPATENRSTSALAETFGQRLTRMRTLRGMTKVQLADRTGVTDMAIGYWERDQRIPSAENLAALATVFRVPMDVLWRGSPRQRRAS